uniref:Uncharacterized protein n=1 Tax=Arundo donax TaxID=35708 RepID=A0A0A8Z7G6_ARUDO
MTMRRRRRKGKGEEEELGGAVAEVNVPLPALPDGPLLGGAVDGEPSLVIDGVAASVD